MQLWTLFFTLAFTTASEVNVVYAINCGSKKGFTDGFGIQFTPDAYFMGGKTSDYGEQFEEIWDDIPDKEAYLTERYSTDDIIYQLPLGKGKYVLDLKFSEVFFDSDNQKVFDVVLGLDHVVKGLDIFKQVGKFKGYDEFLEISIDEQGVTFKGKLMRDAYADGKLVLKFVPGTRDNPKINGIVVFSGTFADTTYNEKMNYLRNLRKTKDQRNLQEKIRKTGTVEEISKSSRLATLGNQGYIKNSLFSDNTIDSPLRKMLHEFLETSYALEGAIYGITVLIFLLVIWKW